MGRQNAVETGKRTQRVTPVVGGILERAAVRSVPERAVPFTAHETPDVAPRASVDTRFGHDFSRVPARAPEPAATRNEPGVSGPLFPVPAQARLQVGQPGDEYEREADRVAEQVMRVPERQASQEMGVLDWSQAPRLNSQRSAPRAAPAVLPSVHEVLRSPGQPLDPATRAFMEPRFGQDLSRVRVHADAQAAGSARSVGAQAYTVGRDIVFGTGRYEPGMGKGLWLLAHELTHVVQQDGLSNGGDRRFCGPGAPVLQRALIPPSLERLSRPAPATSPPTSQPATTPRIQFRVPPDIENAVNDAFRGVANDPRRYESDFIDILLAPEYDRVRITLNFFIHQFPNVYRLLDTNLRAAIRAGVQDVTMQEAVFNQTISNIANMVFLPLAQQWDQRNPSFHRRLEQERRRRMERPLIRVRPGERLA